MSTFPAGVQLWVELSVVSLVSAETSSGGHCSSWSDPTPDTDPGTVIGFSNLCSSKYIVHRYSQYLEGWPTRLEICYKWVFKNESGGLSTKTSSLMGLVCKDPGNLNPEYCRFWGTSMTKLKNSTEYWVVLTTCISLSILRKICLRRQFIVMFPSSSPPLHCTPEIYNESPLFPPPPQKLGWYKSGISQQVAFNDHEDLSSVPSFVSGAPQLAIFLLQHCGHSLQYSGELGRLNIRAPNFC